MNFFYEAGKVGPFKAVEFSFWQEATQILCVLCKPLPHQFHHETNVCREKFSEML